jgi:hypothetical protein
MGKLKFFVTMHEINHCKCFVKKLYHVMIYLQMEQESWRFVSLAYGSNWWEIGLFWMNWWS